MVAHWAPNYKNHRMKIIYVSFLNWQSLHYKHEKIRPQISKVTELFLLNYGKPSISLTGVLISFISLILLQPLQTSKLTKNQQNTFVLVLYVKIFLDDYTLNYKPLLMINLKFSCWNLHTRITLTEINIRNFEHEDLLVINETVQSKINFC